MAKKKPDRELIWNIERATIARGLDVSAKWERIAAVYDEDTARAMLNGLMDREMSTGTLDIAKDVLWRVCKRRFPWLEFSWRERAASLDREKLIDRHVLGGGIDAPEMSIIQCAAPRGKKSLREGLTIMRVSVRGGGNTSVIGPSHPNT